MMVGYRWSRMAHLMYELRMIHYSVWGSVNHQSCDGESLINGSNTGWSQRLAMMKVNKHHYYITSIWFSHNNHQLLLCSQWPLSNYQPHKNNIGQSWWIAVDHNWILTIEKHMGNIAIGAINKSNWSTKTSSHVPHRHFGTPTTLLRKCWSS